MFFCAEEEGSRFARRPRCPKKRRRHDHNNDKGTQPSLATAVSLVASGRGDSWALGEAAAPRSNDWGEFLVAESAKAAPTASVGGELLEEGAAALQRPARRPSATALVEEVLARQPWPCTCTRAKGPRAAAAAKTRQRGARARPSAGAAVVRAGAHP